MSNFDTPNANAPQSPNWEERHALSSYTCPYLPSRRKPAPPQPRGGASDKDGDSGQGI